MPQKYFDVCSRAQDGYHAPARFRIDPNTFRAMAIAAVAAMKATGCSEMSFPAERLGLELFEHMGIEDDGSDRFTVYKDSDVMDWRPFIRIHATGNFGIELRSSDHRVVADGASADFEPPIDPATILPMLDGAAVHVAVTALQLLVAKTDVGSRPSEEDYDDMESAYGNGVDVTGFEDGVLAAVALNAMKIALQEPAVGDRVAHELRSAAEFHIAMLAEDGEDDEVDKDVPGLPS